MEAFSEGSVGEAGFLCCICVYPGLRNKISESRLRFGPDAFLFIGL